LQAFLGREIPVGLWQFATDGGHLAQAGIATIGFAPAEERFAHTVYDQVRLDQLRQALLGNAALALALPDTDEGSRS
jgi:acetylornithine deacetylase/succinyl-diaminopimelate desuccinylase-like protein